MESSQQFDQKKRVYPNLPPDTHPAVREAINTLHDYTYQLRDENQKLRADLDEHKKTTAKPKFSDNIQGIKCKAVTDQTALSANSNGGFYWQYNTKSGQLELAAPGSFAT